MCWGLFLLSSEPFWHPPLLGLSPEIPILWTFQAYSLANLSINFDHKNPAWLALLWYNLIMCMLMPSRDEKRGLCAVGQWSSKCSLWTSNSITRELTWNANSWAPTSDLLNQKIRVGCGMGNLCFNNPSRWFYSTFRFWNCSRKVSSFPCSSNTWDKNLSYCFHCSFTSGHRK